MDGENKGKPYEQMDDLGGFPIFLETPLFFSYTLYFSVFSIFIGMRNPFQ